MCYITLAVSDRLMNHLRFHSKFRLYGSKADSVILLRMRYSQGDRSSSCECDGEEAFVFEGMVEDQRLAIELR